MTSADRARVWLRPLPERLRRKYIPRVMRSILDVATWRTRRRLRQGAPVSILIDNSVLGHAVTHETASIPKTIKWGADTLDTHYAARVPVHAPDNTSEIYRNLTWLTGIAHLARRGHIRFCTSAELRDETFRQPAGRFRRGYGLYDYSLFNDIPLEAVDRLDGNSVIGPSWMKLPSLRDQQLARIKACEDPLFTALLKRLGERQNLDAWHIFTAERQGMHCFLTMDFKLRKTVERWKDHEPFRSMKTQVLTPEELGREWKIMPVSPRLHAYDGASFPVRLDLHMPGEKRAPASAYGKKRKR